MVTLSSRCKQRHMHLVGSDVETFLFPRHVFAYATLIHFALAEPAGHLILYIELTASGLAATFRQQHNALVILSALIRQMAIVAMQGKLGNGTQLHK